MQHSQRWWQRRPRLRPTTAFGVAALLAVCASAGGAYAAIRLPAKGTPCNATTATQIVFPSLAAFEGNGTAPGSTGTVIRGNGVILSALAGGPAGQSGPVVVTLADGERVPAQSLGSDPATGIALWKIDRKQLPFLLLSPRESVRPGLPVVALGSPLLADGTVLPGTVQQVGAAVPAGSGTASIAGAIATGLTVPPGDLGAPVVTCDHRMVGVVVGRSDGGTAVVAPAEAVERSVNRLLGIG